MMCVVVEIRGRELIRWRRDDLKGAKIRFGQGLKNIGWGSAPLFLFQLQKAGPFFQLISLVKCTLDRHLITPLFLRRFINTPLGQLYVLYILRDILENRMKSTCILHSIINIIFRRENAIISCNVTLLECFPRFV